MFRQYFNWTHLLFSSGAWCDLTDGSLGFFQPLPFFADAAAGFGFSSGTNSSEPPPSLLMFLAATLTSHLAARRESSSSRRS